VDRDLSAACGLTTALWEARSAFGCCADAPPFGWKRRSTGTRRKTSLLQQEEKKILMPKGFPRS
jgi:hypothetical protein